jgi:iron complex transport system ATP-binding protein
MVLIVRELRVEIDHSVIIDDISLTVRPGETVALLGPNGAGKSTLVKAMAGVLSAAGGTARMAVDDNDDFQPDPIHQIAYLPQEGMAQTGLTVLESVLLGRHDKLGLRVSDADLIAAHKALDQFGVTELADRRLDSLSGGQRQLAGLGQVLYREPKVMLLDEPTSALDLYRQMLVLDNLRSLANERHMAVVCVLHDLSLAARFAERVLFMKEGRLIADDLCHSAMNADMVSQIYSIVRTPE